MLKKVSIIVCTYNAKGDLKECLDSLEKQDYPKKEIVVVNDASTDDTLQFLLQYQQETTVDIVIVTNETNYGVAGSRNVGISQARGEIIAFTDADCVADPSWISQLVKGYDFNEVAAVGGSILSKRITNIWELSDKGHDFVASEEGYVSYIQGCNMSFDNNLLKQYMFNDDLKYGYEETLLCAYLLRDGHKIYYRPQALVFHKHRTSLAAIMKRKYLLGVSSVWYRKKLDKLFVFKRHIILFIALSFIFFIGESNFFMYSSCVCFIIFCFGLLRDEVMFGKKNIKEIVITFPFLIFIEFAHFFGSIMGLLKFRVLKDIIKDKRKVE
ncbi:MAG: glycosyltransferase family A protein [Thermodesulfobacteriota bacterium]|nr:glycosyltransferase family A protein [Thermodesulfobacteriota bacterium]